MIVSKYNQNNDSSISNNYKALYNYANNLNQNEFAHIFRFFDDISQYLNYSNCTIKHGMKFELIKISIIYFRNELETMI